MTSLLRLMWLCSLGAWAVQPTLAQDAPDAEAEVQGAWFRPSLSVANDPVCPGVLSTVDERFHSTKSLGFNQAPAENYNLGPLVPDHHETYGWENVPVAIGDLQWYVSAKRFPGCGSGCDRYSFIASAAPLPPSETINDDPDPRHSSTPAVEDFRVYRDTTDALFVAQHADDTLLLLKLTRAGRWEAACSIALAPNLRESNDKALADVRASTQRLLGAVDSLRNREANCGSLHSHSRRGEWMRQGFEVALYRPWSLTSPEQYPSGGLRAWAMTGVAEHAAYLQFERELSTTTLALAQFYRHKFGWEEATAQTAADRAVRTAIGRGFAMGGYEPFRTEQEVQIRKAIIARAPLDTLEAIGATAEQLAYRDQELSYRADSVLNLAVAYPAALRYLLDLGLDPNVTNEFGKTPLMYAAQQNEVESMRLLLERGADPNSATTEPSDRCRYSLETFGVTALHYAVRYASAEAIEALLVAGAVEFAEARGTLGGTPITWLRRYAGSAAIERNPNLDDVAIPRIANLLEPDSAARSIAQANERIIEAESRYAAGDIAGAYRLLRAALLAAPGSLRALSDMSLVALKAGSPGESLRASRAVIASTHDAAQRASAWFNLGLACESIGRARTLFDGTQYCQHSLITPFIRAWDARHSSASEAKIATQFERVAACSIPAGEHDAIALLFTWEALPDEAASDRVTRLYVKHGRNVTPDPERLQWIQKDTDRTTRLETDVVVVPRFAHRRDLQDFSITEFAVDRTLPRTVRIGERDCDSYWGLKRP